MTQAEIVNAVLAALEGKAGKTARKPMKVKTKRSFKPVGETKEERQAYVAQKTKEAFKKAGYGDVTPREDVLTYGKFLEKGLRVKAGQKAVKVGTLRLFHISQCEAV